MRMYAFPLRWLMSLTAWALKCSCPYCRIMPTESVHVLMANGSYQIFAGCPCATACTVCLAHLKAPTEKS